MQRSDFKKTILPTLIIVTLLIVLTIVISLHLSGNADLKHQ